MLSVLQQILTLNPQWRICSDGIKAFYDPPFALTATNGLEVPHWTNNPGIVTPLTTSAQVGPSPMPVTVTPTSRYPSITSTTVNVDPDMPLESTSPSSKENAFSAPVATIASQGPPPTVSVPSPSPQSSIVPGPAVITNTNDQSKQTSSRVVVNDFTFTPTARSDPGISPGPANVLTVGGRAFTPVAESPGAIIFDGTTLTQGGAPTTIDAIPIIVTGGSIYVNGQAVAIPTAATAILPTVNPHMMTTIAGQQISIINPSAALIGSQTIVIGQPAITISGQPISLGPSGLVIGSSTVQLPIPIPATRGIISSETIALPPSNIVVAGSTLTPGSPGITVGGTYISLGSTVLVVGSKIEVYAPDGETATAASGGLGALIMSGFGAIGVSPVSSSPTGAGIPGSLYGMPFTGDARRMGSRLSFLVVILGVLLFWVVIFLASCL
ncbi:MAG: hypothetical protein Q9187_008692 [Circinaria calcarea]